MVSKELNVYAEYEDEKYNYDQSKYVSDAIGINDDDSISDKMREYRLKPILKKLGYDVTFTGSSE